MVSETEVDGEVAAPETEKATRRKRTDETLKYPVGTKVEILSGPYAGLTGFVVSRKEGHRSRLIVDYGKGTVTVGPRQIRIVANNPEFV